MSETVFILNSWQKTPVYHAFGRIKTFPEGDNGDVTACGLTMYRAGEFEYSARLRADHADLFALPCKHCFEIKDQP